MPPALVGRDDEVAVLRALLGRSEDHGAVLLVRGEPGVGKSSLLDVVAREAVQAGRQVLRVTGVESEAQVPWSGLHRLLGSVLPLADRLPEPQRAALLSAFGLAAPAAPPYLVGYAALELVADRAADAPVVLLVDDVQWIDPASACALAFLARRIQDEPVAVVAAQRDGVDSALSDGTFPELVVGPLDDTHAAEVLERAGALSTGARREVLRLAEGNPLALVELSRSWTPTDAGLVAPGAMTSRLERAFARRLEDLCDDVRLAALVVAADDTDSLVEVVRATELVAGDSHAEDLLAEAVDAGVLVVEGSAVRFRHPLVRSACYQGATPSERRAAHAALAEVLVASTGRRTWHLAASTVGPADDVADDLEAAADRAIEQGATRAAVAALARAAELSGTALERGRRLVGAAELAFDSGLYQEGTALLVRVDAADLSEEHRLRLSWLHEVFGDRAWSGAAKVPALCDVASRLAAEGEREHALKMMVSLALRCWWSNADATTRLGLVEAAEGVGAAPDDPTLLAIVGYAAPVERGRAVGQRIAALTPGVLGDAIDDLDLGAAATGIGAFPLAAPLLDSAVSRFRSRGEMPLLLQALVSRMLTDHHLGRWQAARAAGDEVQRLAVDTGERLWGMAGAATEALVAAAQGDDEGADYLGRTAEAFFLPLGAHTFLAPVELARTLSAVAHGRHEQALHHVRRVFDPASPVHHANARHWGSVDHVVSALALDQRAEAGQVVEELESVWEASRSPLVGASLLVARPLVATGSRAEALFVDGLRGGLVPWPFLHARHLLAYGTWLRRRRRSRDSRPHLRSARDMFDALGAAPWVDQANRELRASGETVREPDRGAGDLLSPQERQIAQLAASGLTNREIGQHLYLSHRTVGSHLYRIFPKLGITSRAQLVSALGGSRPGTGAT
ncbi:helix-turn-helix transcriptional regulator [Nocardioides renjunii]|uniref:helix-turn-helix transcriptional regulator n=1 Tax=Nocardioides renjunii TaxID=3095075 RepID=UPI002AFF525C|nr:AAA family ATPase [Nocardioides sp. S-34]WQQ23988.1 AAA family ATPase [Nocardioides sp. S-34]